MTATVVRGLNPDSPFPLVRAGAVQADELRLLAAEVILRGHHIDLVVRKLISQNISLRRSRFSDGGSEAFGLGCEACRSSGP